MSKFYIASDYAGVSGGGIAFYYGYEETFREEWCFVVRKNGKETMRIPSTELGGDRFNVAENLLIGISKWLQHYDAASSEEKK